MSAPHEGDTKDGKIFHNGHWMSLADYQKEKQSHIENKGEHDHH